MTNYYLLIDVFALSDKSLSVGPPINSFIFVKLSYDIAVRMNDLKLSTHCANVYSTVNTRSIPSDVLSFALGLILICAFLVNF